MKTVSGAIDTANAGTHWITCYLLKLFFDSGTQYVASAGADIIFGGNTYKGAGAAGQIQEVTESITGKVTGLQFEIAGPISAYLALALTEQIKGRACELYVAWFNPGSYIPFDVCLEWAGIMDTMPVTDRPNESRIAITAENKFITFDRARARRHNMADHQIDFPGDQFYQYLAEMTQRTIIFPAKEFFNK